MHKNYEPPLFSCPLPAPPLLLPSGHPLHSSFSARLSPQHHSMSISSDPVSTTVLSRCHWQGCVCVSASARVFVEKTKPVYPTDRSTQTHDLVQNVCFSYCSSYFLVKSTVCMSYFKIGSQLSTLRDGTSTNQ